MTAWPPSYAFLPLYSDEFDASPDDYTVCPCCARHRLEHSDIEWAECVIEYRGKVRLASALARWYADEEKLVDDYYSFMVSLNPVDESS